MRKIVRFTEGKAFFERKKWMFFLHITLCLTVYIVLTQMYVCVKNEYNMYDDERGKYALI